MMKPILYVAALLLVSACQITAVEKKGGGGSYEMDMADCNEQAPVAGIDTYNYKIPVGDSYQSPDDCMEAKGYEKSYHIPWF